MELAADLGGARGPLEELDAVQAQRRLGIGQAVPELQRALVLSLRRGEGACLVRGVPGPDRCHGCPRVVPGRRPVVGELRPVTRGTGPARRRPSLECLGVGAVERSSLAGQHVVIRGFLDQCVAERIARRVAFTVLDEQLPVDRGAEALGQVRVGQSRDLREELVVDPPAGDGGDAQDALGRIRGRGDPRDQRRR